MALAEVLFYHLERQTLWEVLPTLLEKTLARGWRAAVEVPDPATRDALDAHLWTYRDDSFLPHGTEADGNAADQPVLLMTGPGNPNGAAVRFLAERAAPEGIEGYERVVLLFSADDADAVTEARRHWPALKRAGHTLTYWQQAPNGRWDKKA